MSAPPDVPLVVIRGNATEEEVAALVTVVQGLAAAAASAAAAQAARPAVGEWGAAHRKVRSQHPVGPGGWRASALPR